MCAILLILGNSDPKKDNLLNFLLGQGVGVFLDYTVLYFLPLAVSKQKINSEMQTNLSSQRKRVKKICGLKYKTLNFDDEVQNM